ncbi:hypothetical protein RUND412_010079, partial [Rhizina undulata]
MDVPGPSALPCVTIPTSPASSVYNPNPLAVDMMSKYLEGKAQERKFPPFGPLWGKYLGPDEPCRQEPLSPDAKSIPVEAESNRSQPRSDKITSNPLAVDMMSKYSERRAQERKFPPFGPLWGKYLGPDVPKYIGTDVPFRQEPLSRDAKPLHVEAESHRSHPRSDEITSVPVDDGASGNTKIGARATLKEGIEMTTNACADPRSSLKHAREALILGGEHEGLEEVDGRPESAHRQTKKLRASVSSSTLTATSTGKVQNIVTPEPSVEVVVHEPFSFQHEKWLLVHITGHYPLGHETICWNTVSAEYQDQFTVGRSASSLEDKWNEMAKRGVSIDYYEPKELIQISRAPAPGPHTSSHDIEAPFPDLPADSGNQWTGNDIKPSENFRRRLYTAEETNWLLDWIRLNTAPGKKRSWLDCDQAFEKEF